MTAPVTWPEPAWLAEVPESERECALIGFHVALATLYANRRMSIMQFSKDIGFDDKTVSIAKNAGKVSPDMATRIEKALGSDLFPWKLFRPQA